MREKKNVWKGFRKDIGTEALKQCRSIKYESVLLQNPDSDAPLLK